VSLGLEHIGVEQQADSQLDLERALEQLAGRDQRQALELGAAGRPSRAVPDHLGLSTPGARLVR